MTPTRRDVETPIEVSLIRLIEGILRRLRLLSDVSEGYLPGGAPFLSSIIHELDIAMLLLTFVFSRTHLPSPRAFNDSIKLSDATVVVYLPVHGGR